MEAQLEHVASLPSWEQKDKADAAWCLFGGLSLVRMVQFPASCQAFKGLKVLMVPLKIQLANKLFCANGINIRYTCLAHLQAFFLTSFTQLVFLCLI